MDAPGVWEPLPPQSQPALFLTQAWAPISGYICSLMLPISSAQAAFTHHSVHAIREQAWVPVSSSVLIETESLIEGTSARLAEIFLPQLASVCSSAWIS